MTDRIDNALFLCSGHSARVFTALPLASPGRMTLGSKRVEIGQLQGATRPCPSAA